MTSLKFQTIYGTSPHLHDWDQRGDLFSGSDKGDEHATLFEIDPITGTVGDFLTRIAGHALAPIIKPIIHNLGIVPDIELIEAVEQFGTEINAELAHIKFAGHSLRIALMDGAEE